MEGVQPCEFRGTTPWISVGDLVEIVCTSLRCPQAAGE